MFEEFLKTLTLRQKEAVEHASGPLLILAGAGTGKTTTITGKIACMIKKQGIKPKKILALTFSRETVRNMEKKIYELLGQEAYVKVSTFHAFCAELIRDNSEKCGVSEKFTIFEDIDAAILFYKGLGTTLRNAALYSGTIAKAKDFNISISNFKDYLEAKKEFLLYFTEESMLEQFYTECKVNLNTFHLKGKDQQKALKDVKKNWQEFIGLYDGYQRYADFIYAWENYEERKKTLNCLDYGDLNRITLDFLNTYGTAELNDTYTHIIVDEFQDTNYMQFELIKHLTAREQNITVVADANQSIYAFRGAYSNNIEEFKKQFGISEKDIVFLDTSFRSTNKILKVVHRLISHNYPEDRKSECLLFKNCNDHEGKNVVIQETKNDVEEARKIVEQIGSYIEKGIPLREITVLYRTHNQGRLIKQALQKHEIPIIVKNEADYLRQPEIKIVLSYFYILNNLMDLTPRWTEAWWRIFRYNNSLDKSDSGMIREYIKKNKISFQEAIYNHLDEIELSEKGCATVEKVKEIIRILNEKKLLDASDLLLEIYDLSELVRYLNRLDTLRAKEALLNLRNLHEIAKNFEQFHNKEFFGFIDYLEILDEMGGNPASAKIREDDAVSLMNIHAARGLEFRVVFVTSMAKDKFPLLRGGPDFLIPLEMMEQYRDLFSAQLSETELEKAIKERKKEIRFEEERRLCYVAFTRAKEDLIISLSLEYGGKEREPSEFLMEIGYDHWRDLETPLDREAGTNIEMETPFDALDLSYRRDLEIKTTGLVRDNELEREKNRCIQLLIGALDKDLKESVHYLMLYRALKDGGCKNYLEEIQQNWSLIDPAEKAEKIFTKIKTGSNILKFNPEELSFSFSALKAYENCPKQYELQEILRMPSRKNEDLTGVMAKGSFVHEVLEIAVKEKVSEKQALYEIAETLHNKTDWMYVDLESTFPLFEVFWLRNKDRISNNLMVEKWFTVPIEDFVFKGKIDRVDLLDSSRKEVEIIDYKTGKYDVSPEDRSRQLLLYTKGFKHMHPEYQVKRLTLDMLAMEKPRSFELQEDGEYRSTEGRVSPLDSGAISAMVQTARNIAHDYEHGFKETDDPELCMECGFRLYCNGANFKDLLEEIQEKAKTACRESQGTDTEEIACAVSREVQKWEVSNPTDMAEYIEDISYSLRGKVQSHPENEYLLHKIGLMRNETDLTKKFQLLSFIIGEIPTIKVVSEGVVERGIDGIRQDIASVGKKIDENSTTILNKLDKIQEELNIGFEKLDELSTEIGGREGEQIRSFSEKLLELTKKGDSKAIERFLEELLKDETALIKETDSSSAPENEKEESKRSISKLRSLLEKVKNPTKAFGKDVTKEIVVGYAAKGIIDFVIPMMFLAVFGVPMPSHITEILAIVAKELKE